MEGTLSLDINTAKDSSGVASAHNAGGRQHSGYRSSNHAPLKHFRQVKEDINGIFESIEVYIDECVDFIVNFGNHLPNDGVGPAGENNVELSSNSSSSLMTRILHPDASQQVQQYLTKVTGIREVIARNHMKCAFFGRTSNGKSTVINAMLGARVLPTGIGHTTNCFLQVEGTAQESSFLLTPESTEPKSVDSVAGLATAIHTASLSIDSLLRICWPKNKCGILKDDVVFLDSPGIDVTENLDLLIDNHCLDADVFILVCNSESTLMQTEKKFFHRVAQRLSKPNMFILNNRWDCSAGEEESAELVKKQHMERTTSFLAEELAVCSLEDAKERVYFVSAKEVLTSRLREAGTPSPSGAFQEGWHNRLFEFQNFEKHFEKLLSDSAIKTKFAAHTQQGQEITKKMRSIMDSVYETAVEEKDLVVKTRQDTQRLAESMRKKLAKTNLHVERDINQTLEKVERQVSAAFNEEIRRLADLVDDFDRPFHPDPMMLVVYKAELNEHVERTLGRKLGDTCAKQMHREVGSTLEVLLKSYCEVLTPEDRGQVSGHAGGHLWEPAIHVDCRSICADFHEDIQFRFSLSAGQLLRRLLGGAAGGSAPGLRSGAHRYYARMPHGGAASTAPAWQQQPPALTPMTPSNEPPRIGAAMSAAAAAASGRMEVLPLLLQAFPSLLSRNSVGAVVVFGVVVRATGWRVLGVCGAVYAGLYLYERVSWTNKAKERTFKRQYVEYASQKLRLIVDLTSANVSYQAKQELTSHQRKLQHDVDAVDMRYKNDIRCFDWQLGQLEEITGLARRLKNQASFLDNRLSNFHQTYILHNRSGDL